MAYKLDYDKLLADWAEDLYLQVDKCEVEKNKAETGSFKHGYYKGKHDGLMEALTKLTMLEKRKFRKYLIKRTIEKNYEALKKLSDT